MDIEVVVCENLGGAEAVLLARPDVIDVYSVKTEWGITWYQRDSVIFLRAREPGQACILRGLSTS